MFPKHAYTRTVVGALGHLPARAPISNISIAKHSKATPKSLPTPWRPPSDHPILRPDATWRLTPGACSCGVSILLAQGNPADDMSVLSEMPSFR